MKEIEFCENKWANARMNHILRRRDKAYLFYANVQSVSRTGLSRKIKIVMVYENEIVNVGQVLKLAKMDFFKIDQDFNFVINGGGMDMIFATINDLIAKIVELAKLKGFKGSTDNLDAGSYYNYL